MMVLLERRHQNFIDISLERNIQIFMIGSSTQTNAAASLCIMCVQYIEGCSVHGGFSVHRGIP